MFKLEVIQDLNSNGELLEIIENNVNKAVKRNIDRFPEDFCFQLTKSKMDKKFIEQDKKFDIIFDQLQLEENIKQRVFFNGQIYDAYSIIIDIIKKANKKILIIDNYIDDSVLKMLAKKKKIIFLFNKKHLYFSYFTYIM